MPRDWFQNLDSTEFSLEAFRTVNYSFCVHKIIQHQSRGIALKWKTVKSLFSSNFSLHSHFVISDNEIFIQIYDFPVIQRRALPQNANCINYF